MKTLKEESRFWVVVFNHTVHEDWIKQHRDFLCELNVALSAKYISAIEFGEMLADYLKREAKFLIN